MEQEENLFTAEHSMMCRTTQPAPHLNGIPMVFGHILQGQEIVSEIENQRVDDKNRPLFEVKISNCGELIPISQGKSYGEENREEKCQKDSESSISSLESGSSSDTESENESSADETRRKKRSRKRKRQKRNDALKRKEKKKAKEKRKEIKERQV